jgi:16S rRNA (guanine527-N7)-methyltransferase
MNLTRIPREEAWLRHFVDSLLFQDLVPQGVEVLDVGTGPGFPAWPLACARPDLKVVALDSNGKMLGFLRSQPLPNLEVVQERAEEWDQRERFDVVTGRAVAPLPIQLELSAPFLKVGGLLIPMRTPADNLAEPDWEVLGLRPAGLHRRSLPGTDVVRVFPLFAKERPCPNWCPRRWAEMKSNPVVRWNPG